MWFLLFLIVLGVLLWPVIKMFIAVNRTRNDFNDAMNQARRQQQEAASQQRKQHPSYTTRNAEDATYEEMPGAPRPQQETATDPSTPSDPIIEDAHWEEI